METIKPSNDLLLAEFLASECTLYTLEKSLLFRYPVVFNLFDTFYFKQQHLRKLHLCLQTYCLTLIVSMIIHSQYPTETRFPGPTLKSGWAWRCFKPLGQSFKGSKNLSLLQLETLARTSFSFLPLATKHLLSLLVGQTIKKSSFKNQNGYRRNVSQKLSFFQNFGMKEWTEFSLFSPSPSSLDFFHLKKWATIFRLNGDGWLIL